MHPAITTPPIAIEVSAPSPIPIHPEPRSHASSSSIPSTPRDASEASTTAPLIDTTATTPSNASTNPCGKLSTMSRKTRKGVLYATAVVLPPLAVYLRRGTNKDLALSVVLTILGWIPGVLFALYHVSKSPVVVVNDRVRERLRCRRG